MNQVRMGRISQEIKKAVSHAISFEMHDPAIDDMTSVSDVSISNDLSYANVYISVMGTQWDKRQTLEALDKASGFLKSRIAEKVKIRQIPELRFHIDESIERGMYMDDLIAKTMEVDRRNQQDRGDLDENGNLIIRDEEDE